MAPVKKSNVPESVPGPARVMFWSGKLGSTWFQLSISESGPQIFASCSTVRHVAQSFSLLVTTAMPSLAI
jgi:hypothetical protein